MCDFSGKLIAWLDRELPAEEAAEVERHLQGCSGCRSDVDAFKRVSIEFDASAEASLSGFWGGGNWVNSRRPCPSLIS